VLLAAYEKVIQEARAEVRALLGERTEEGDKYGPAVGKRPLGRVNHTMPSFTLIVHDEKALTDWVAEWFPSEIEHITRIRPAYRGLFHVSDDGDVVAPDGYTLNPPGTSSDIKPGYVSVTPDMRNIRLLWDELRSELPALVEGTDL